jgi:hypothetical protein
VAGRGALLKMPSRSTICHFDEVKFFSVCRSRCHDAIYRLDSKCLCDTWMLSLQRATHITEDGITTTEPEPQPSNHWLPRHNQADVITQTQAVVVTSEISISKPKWCAQHFNAIKNDLATHLTDVVQKYHHFLYLTTNPFLQKRTLIFLLDYLIDRNLIGSSRYLWIRHTFGHFKVKADAPYSNLIHFSKLIAISDFKARILLWINPNRSFRFNCVTSLVSRIVLFAQVNNFSTSVDIRTS